MSLVLQAYLPHMFHVCRVLVSGVSSMWVSVISVRVMKCVCNTSGEETGIEHVLKGVSPSAVGGAWLKGRKCTRLCTSACTQG